MTQIAPRKNLQAVNVKDFGATGSGSVDDSGAIQAAVDAAANGAVLTFPPGIYRLDREIKIERRSNLSLRADRATIVGGSKRFRSYFHCDGSEGLVFDGFAFDQRGPDLPRFTPQDYGNSYNCPIHFVNGSGLTVRNCEFADLYTLSIFFFQATGLAVDSCIFRCAVSTNDQWLQFIHLQTYGGTNRIARCRFLNAATTNPAYNPAAVFVSGGNAKSALAIVECHAEYCGRNNNRSHRLGVFDVYGDAQNIVVRDNISLNTMAQFMRLSATRNGQISGNRVEISEHAEFDYSTLTVESTIYFAPGQVGCQNIEISGNMFQDPAGRAAFTVGVLSYDWGAPATTITVKGNIFSGCRRSVFVGGPFQDVQIVGNSGRAGRNSIEVGHNGSNAAAVTATRGTEARSSFDGLLIALNVLLNNTASDANAITINLSKTPPYKGKVGRFVIRENSFQRVGRADVGQAIAVAINASTLQGDVEVSNNETRGYAHDWFMRGARNVVVEGNRAFDTGKTQYLDDGTNGSVTRRNNRF